LKILLVTGNYLPFKNGGIENYTHRLAKLLLQYKFVVEVAALNAGSSDEYFYEEIKVNNLNGSFESFHVLLQWGNFSFCHFHEYSAYGGIEIPWFKMAKEYCNKVFFTFHLPYHTCYKNDFRFQGRVDCNRFTDPERCTQCIITDRMALWNFGKFNWLIQPLKIALTISGKKEKLKSKVVQAISQLPQLINTCDDVFIIAHWFEKLLKENGYENLKIKLLPNIINPVSIQKNKSGDGGSRKRLVFVGRIQHQKGLHLLCEAMRKISTNGIEIDVYGNVVDENYFKTCQDIFSFNYIGIIARQELLALLPNYDFLVLPSVFTEMYPMVIQEAFSAGIPVIASAAKGNVDVISEAKYGFIFDYNDHIALAKVIDKAYNLKESGWVPEFKTSDNSSNNILQILSYYNLNIKEKT